MYFRTNFLFVLIACHFSFFQTFSASASETLQYEEIVGDLNEPWGFAFLPGGGVLITEREGRILHVHENTTVELKGGPKVVDQGQGGLLDVMIPRDFTTSRQVYFTYATSQPRGGAGTALAVATLLPGATELTALTELFEMSKDSGTGRHFGSRIVEAEDGTLFITIGDRGIAKNAQDLSKHSGSVIRLNRDGSVPADNPFVSSETAQPEIWSFGHRNPQGAALGPDGQLWVAEHGARGGDEINRIDSGVNYGWPVISYGRNYSGTKIGEGTQKDGMAQPLLYWDPSIAPSGMAFYSGTMFSDWRGDILVGSLKFDYIARIDLETMTEVAQITSRETERVRDVRIAPDGSIWFLSVGNGALYRMTPN